MAWRRPDYKPLSKPIAVYRRIYASLGLNVKIEFYTIPGFFNSREICLLAQGIEWVS